MEEMKKCSDTEHLPPVRGWGWRQPSPKDPANAAVGQLHDHPENFFARRSQATWALGSHGAWREAWLLLCWRRATQLAAAGRLQASSCSRHSPQTVPSGSCTQECFFVYLIRMGEGFASASQSLSEPLAQRQDASFRQRRLDLGTAVPPGQDETALPSVNEPCSRVIVYNHLFTQHSSAGQPCTNSH